MHPPRIAAQLRLAIPLYFQPPPGPHYKCEAAPLGVPLHTGPPGTKQRVPGRGSVNTYLTFPRHFLDPLIWWLSTVKWTKLSRERDDDTHPFQRTTSYYEMVVNFELTTAIRVPGADWTQQPSDFADMLRAVARIFLVTDGDATYTYNNYFAPERSVAALTCLGAPRVPGVHRRPLWLLADRTADVVAANVWQAIANFRLTRSQHSTSFA